MTIQQQKENDLRVGLEKIAKGSASSRLAGGQLINRAIFADATKAARRLGVESTDFFSDWYAEVIRTLERAYKVGKFTSRSGTKFPISAYVAATFRGLGSKIKQQHFEGRPLLKSLYNRIRGIKGLPPPPDKLRVRGKWFFSVAGVRRPSGPAPTPPAAPTLIKSNFRYQATDQEYWDYIARLVRHLGARTTIMEVADRLAEPLEVARPRVYLEMVGDEEEAGSGLDALEDQSARPSRMEEGADLKRLLLRLSSVDRERYLLKVDEGWTFAEISDHFGDRGAEKARTRHRRILRDLKRLRLKTEASHV